MSRDDGDKLASPSSQTETGQAATTSQRPNPAAATPGRRTRTGRLGASAAPGVQRRADTAGGAEAGSGSGADSGSGSGRSALTSQWLERAMRPDLYAKPVQQRADAGGAAQSAGEVHEHAQRGVSGAASALPHGERIQQSFGSHDVGGIQAHVGGAAADASAAIGAQAYATGDHVAFQRAPDLHTAAHEAAHVVQQRAGVQLASGVGQSGDAYERHADAVADRVVQGQSAESLLSEMAPGGGGGGAVQRQDGDTPATGGGETTAPAGGETAGSEATEAGAGGGDAYAAFVAAVNARNRAQIQSTWAACSDEEKRRLGADGELHRRLMFFLKKDSASYLKEGGVDWSDTVTAYSVFLMDDFDQWYEALWSANLYIPFVQAAPRRNSLDLTQAKKLQSWMGKVPGPVNAKMLFEKVYPDLNTTSLYPAWQQVAQWTVARVQRLYNALSDSVPVGHVQTITGGFTLVDKTKKKVGGAWTWVPLGFAWWEPSNFRVVLNASSTGANEGGTGHDMSGGSRSGANAGYTAPDGSAGTQTSLTHFRGSALHEVGHGVGQRMGGDDYALNASSYPQWTALSPEAWADELWINGQTSGAAPAGLSGDAALGEDDAKDFLLTEIRDGAGTWSKWNNSASRVQILQYVAAVYGTQPLYAMWNELFVNMVAKDNFYSVNNPARTQGSWTYGIFTRWHDNNYAKLSSTAFANKVSWYSVSSPKEWFAEQYTHYYRTEKTGGGLIDGATMTLLNRIDQQEFYPNDAAAGGGTVFGSDSGASAGSSAGDRADDQAAAGEEEVYPGGAREPCMFPW